MYVLIVEDDRLLADGLQTAFRREAFDVVHAGDGANARSALQVLDFDIVVLDLGLPDIDGLELLHEIRQRKLKVPVLVLTARDGTEQQVMALDAGADDYMEKPFDLRELQARVRALIRRSHAGQGVALALGTLEVDPYQKEVRIDGDIHDLPAREYEVLESLLLSTPRGVSKARLAQRLALKGEQIGDNAVEVYIHRLRRRLRTAGIHIRTIRNLGYAIEAR